MLTQATQSFQAQVLSLVLNDSKILGQIRPVITQKFWTHPVYEQLARLTLGFYDEHSSSPSCASLAAMTEDYLYTNSDAALHFKKYEEALNFLQDELPSADREFVISNLNSCVREFMMEDAKAEGVVTTAKGDYQAYAAQVAKAANFTINDTNNCLTLEDIANGTEMFMDHNKGLPVSTGFESIDAEMKGGHRPGKVGIIIGGTGSGKSMILINLGINALKNDERVCYISLENMKENIGQRFAAGLCNEDFWELQFDPNKNSATKAKLKTFLAAHPNAALDILYFPNRSIAAPALEAFLKAKYADKPFPTLLLLDYADLLAPTKEYKSEYDNYGLIYAQVVQIAQGFYVPLWTATQANRQGRKTRVVDLDNISDSYKKAWVADVVYAITQSDTDKVSKLMFLFSAKMRDHEGGIKHYFQTQFHKSKLVEVQESKYKVLQTQGPKPPSLISHIGKPAVSVGWMANSNIGKKSA